ncbi:hypothetical protein CC2G_004837 [Coprinopsis cinerea AmutBmut pab1-1]|nr:hypothetical protein CC2G_004837 [Coprinopsis cinerea AmutBmut pab1-1]
MISLDWTNGETSGSSRVQTAWAVNHGDVDHVRFGCTPLYPYRRPVWSEGKIESISSSRSAPTGGTRIRPAPTDPFKNLLSASPTVLISAMELDFSHTSGNFPYYWAHYFPGLIFRLHARGRRLFMSITDVHLYGTPNLMLKKNVWMDDTSALVTPGRKDECHWLSLS